MERHQPGGTRRVLVVDPSDSVIVYAGTDDGNFNSDDAGRRWKAVGLRGLTVRTMAIDPLAPATVCAGTSEGVFRSTDRGRSWSSYSKGLAEPQVSSLALDSRGRTLYAGTYSGVYLLRLDG